MNNQEIYRVWAPARKLWVDWVRPVPFVALDDLEDTFDGPTISELPCIEALNSEFQDAAIIVDAPGAQSVEIGVLLAQHGYRPIPVYNGVTAQCGARATTDNHSVCGALIWGASILRNIAIPDNARPAFLIDSNRLHRRKIDASVFDNSWDIYHQDIPTDEYLLKQGINKILIIGEKFNKDLKEILTKDYQKKKLSIYLTNGYNTPRLVKKGRK